VFETVLVADHGPLARRVVRTCQRLGARTVVVHADDDRNAPAVKAADEAVPLGGSGWADTYGDARKLLEAADRTDAQAVHPGGGPLAEDAALARAVLEAGLVWLGGPPEALERTQQQMAELAGSIGLAPAAPQGRRLVVTTLHDAVLGIREQARRDGAPLLDRQPVDLPDEVLRCVEHAALVVARAAGGGPLNAVGLTVDGETVGVAAVLPVLLLGSVSPPRTRPASTWSRRSSGWPQGTRRRPQRERGTPSPCTCAPPTASAGGCGGGACRRRTTPTACGSTRASARATGSP